MHIVTFDFNAMHFVFYIISFSECYLDNALVQSYLKTSRNKIEKDARITKQKSWFYLS